MYDINKPWNYYAKWKILTSKATSCVIPFILNDGKGIFIEKK